MQKCPNTWQDLAFLTVAINGKYFQRVHTAKMYISVALSYVYATALASVAFVQPDILLVGMCGKDGFLVFQAEFAGLSFRQKTIF